MMRFQPVVCDDVIQKAGVFSPWSSFCCGLSVLGSFQNSTEFECFEMMRDVNAQPTSRTQERAPINLAVSTGNSIFCRVVAVVLISYLACTCTFLILAVSTITSMVVGFSSGDFVST